MVPLNERNRLEFDPELLFIYTTKAIRGKLKHVGPSPNSNTLTLTSPNNTTRKWLAIDESNDGAII